MSRLQVDFVWATQDGMRAARSCETAVIVDVLSFSTSVDIATARGARVYPYPDHDVRAADFARAHGAILAGARSHTVASLSPQSLGGIPSDTRLVLPSPNGAMLSLEVQAPLVLAGCLRNASAVARHAQRRGGSACVIAAGERRLAADLRFALEDLLGAGAIVAALRGVPSTEARFARSQFRRFQTTLHAALRSVPSGVELCERGFAADVELAARLDASTAVPLLSYGAFSNVNVVDKIVNY